MRIWHHDNARCCRQYTHLRRCQLPTETYRMDEDRRALIAQFAFFLRWKGYYFMSKHLGFFPVRVENEEEEITRLFDEFIEWKEKEEAKKLMDG